MADRGASAPRGGGFGSRGGDRGRGRGRGRGRRGGKSEEKEWQPVTKLGRLVKAGKINSMEEIYLHSLPIKEYQIVDFFLPKLKDEVMKVRAHNTMQQNCYNNNIPKTERPTTNYFQTPEIENYRKPTICPTMRNWRSWGRGLQVV